MKLNLLWQAEAIGKGTDRISGARIIQLTSSSCISNNIYCEERYTTTDGKRIAFTRSCACSSINNGIETQQLWLYDLETGQAAFICDKVIGHPASPRYKNTLYFIRINKNSERILTRLDMATMEQEDIFDMNKAPAWRYPVCTVSPDERWFVGNYRVRGEIYGLYRIDMKKGTIEFFHEHKDICNPHPQFEPSKGEKILIQLNRGCKLDKEGNIITLVGPKGATLYVIDADGKNECPLPVGLPYTGHVTGHECWIGKTGRIILTTWSPECREVLDVAPGDKKARVIWHGKSFSHIASSDDGRYFISDDIRNGLLYIGSIKTGRVFPLCETGATSGNPQYAHIHAYMTPDNKFVIYNSDKTGIGQIYAAEIPAGFLESLDQPPPY